MSLIAKIVIGNSKYKVWKWNHPHLDFFLAKSEKKWIERNRDRSETKGPKSPEQGIESFSFNNTYFTKWNKN